jgi:hypothetical protein
LRHSTYVKECLSLLNKSIIATILVLTHSGHLGFLCETMVGRPWPLSRRFTMPKQHPRANQSSRNRARSVRKRPAHQTKPGQRAHTPGLLLLSYEVGVLPLVNRILDRMRFESILLEHLPEDDRRGGTGRFSTRARFDRASWNRLDPNQGMRSCQRQLDGVQATTTGAKSSRGRAEVRMSRSTALG